MAQVNGDAIFIKYNFKYNCSAHVIKIHLCVLFSERRGIPLLQAHTGQRAPRHPLDGDALGQAEAGHVGT
jgi:hypothetical protein